MNSNVTDRDTNRNPSESATGSNTAPTWRHINWEKGSGSAPLETRTPLPSSRPTSTHRLDDEEDECPMDADDPVPTTPSLSPSSIQAHIFSRRAIETTDGPEYQHVDCIRHAGCHFYPMKNPASDAERKEHEVGEYFQRERVSKTPRSESLSCPKPAGQMRRKSQDEQVLDEVDAEL
ncbi:unnamed protein product [Diplocarpon coronariae]